MDTQGVLTRFIMLANIPSAQSSAWQELAADCAADIASRIDSVYDTSENSRVLESAAAALALYRYRVGLCTDIVNNEQSTSTTGSDPETTPEDPTDTNTDPVRELTSFKVGDVTLEFGSSGSGSGSSSGGSGTSSGSSSGASSAAKFGSGVSEAYEMYKQALEACEQWFKKTTMSSEFVFGRMESLCTES